MNQHIYTVHKLDYSGDPETLLLALTIKAEEYRAAIVTQEDASTIEFTLVRGTFSEAQELRSFAEGVITAQEITLRESSELLEALKGLFEHCAMIHKSWGDSDNSRAADDAIAAARAAIDKAESR